MCPKQEPLCTGSTCEALSFFCSSAAIFKFKRSRRSPVSANLEQMLPSESRGWFSCRKNLSDLAAPSCLVLGGYNSSNTATALLLSLLEFQPESCHSFAFPQNPNCSKASQLLRPTSWKLRRTRACLRATPKSSPPLSS